MVGLVILEVAINGRVSIKVLNVIHVTLGATLGVTLHQGIAQVDTVVPLVGAPVEILNGVQLSCQQVLLVAVAGQGGASVHLTFSLAG